MFIAGKLGGNIFRNRFARRGDYRRKLIIELYGDRLAITQINYLLEEYTAEDVLMSSRCRLSALEELLSLMY